MPATSKIPKRVKVGTAMKKEVYDQLKRRALEEQRPIQDVLEDAVVFYAAAPSPEMGKRMAAVRQLCTNPFPNVSDKDWDEVMETEIYDG